MPARGPPARTRNPTGYPPRRAHSPCTSVPTGRSKPSSTAPGSRPRFARSIDRRAASAATDPLAHRPDTSPSVRENVNKRKRTLCRKLRLDQVAGRSPWTAPASQRPRSSAHGVIGWRLGCLAELARSLLPGSPVVAVPGASVRVWVWQCGRPVPRVTP